MILVLYFFYIHILNVPLNQYAKVEVVRYVNIHLDGNRPTGIYEYEVSGWIEGPGISKSYSFSRDNADVEVSRGIESATTVTVTATFSYKRSNSDDWREGNATVSPSSQSWNEGESGYKTFSVFVYTIS